MGFGLLIIGLLIVFVVRWIRFVKQNTDKQIEQNAEIINLLKGISRKISKDDHLE